MNGSPAGPWRSCEMLPSEQNAKTDVDSGEYERHYRPSSTDTVLDLGANVGYFTERMAPQVARVIAFEPMLENFLFLTRRVEEFAHVVAFNLGALDCYTLKLLFRHVLNCG